VRRHHDAPQCASGGRTRPAIPDASTRSVKTPRTHTNALPRAMLSSRVPGKTRFRPRPPRPRGRDRSEDRVAVDAVCLRGRRMARGKLPRLTASSHSCRSATQTQRHPLDAARQPLPIVAADGLAAGTDGGHRHPAISRSAPRSAARETAAEVRLRPTAPPACLPSPRVQDGPGDHRARSSSRRRPV
jgi:hypothetical protein